MSTDSIPIVVDDNYAALKAPEVGAAVSADLSAFSLFKLGAPEGLGCVLGRTSLVERIRPFVNSGGSVVQGPEATGALKALARGARHGQAERRVA